MFVSLRLSRCSTPSQNYTSTAAHNFLLIVDSGGHECLSLLDRLIVRLFPLFCADAKLDPCQNSPTKQFFKPNIGITHQLRGYCYALKFILITARLGASQCRTRKRDSVSLRFLTPGIPTTQPTSACTCPRSF